MKTRKEIYYWQMSKLAPDFLNQQIFSTLSVNILTYFLPIALFFFHEQQICHFCSSPAGGLLEGDRIAQSLEGTSCFMSRVPWVL